LLQSAWIEVEGFVSFYVVDELFERAMVEDDPIFDWMKGCLVPDVFWYDARGFGRDGRYW
jgi:hypothetical protein